MATAAAKPKTAEPTPEELAATKVQAIARARKSRAEVDNLQERARVEYLKYYIATGVRKASPLSCSAPLRFCRTPLWP